MADSVITDLSDFLDHNGELHDSSGRPLAQYLCRIVEAVTQSSGDDAPETDVCCRRSNRRQCSGRILARIESNGEHIRWLCPVCDDNGWISGWQRTKWDHLGGAESKDIRRITFSSGMLGNLRERVRLPRVTLEDAAITSSIVEAMWANDLIDVSGTFGDPNLGEPIQYDELTVEYGGSTDTIVVYNRAILLFATKDPFYVRFHRVASLLEDAARQRGEDPQQPDPEFIPPDENLSVDGDSTRGAPQRQPPGGDHRRNVLKLGGRQTTKPKQRNRDPLAFKDLTPPAGPTPRGDARDFGDGPRTGPSHTRTRRSGGGRVSDETKRKVSWSGTLLGVQPRIRLSRSFDERYHTYQGFVLLVDGEVDGVDGRFSIGIGKVTQSKHEFRGGDEVSGNAWTVPDPRRVAADYYKASRLRVLERASEVAREGPPWFGVPPELDVYRERGHVRLAARTYSTKCAGCQWACRMAVDMIIDQWNPTIRYRFETFCYGPKSCWLYAAGPTRKVPGRHGMSFEEEDWVDEDATSHRSPDE